MKINMNLNMKVILLAFQVYHIGALDLHNASEHDQLILQNSISPRINNYLNLENELTNNDNLKTVVRIPRQTVLNDALHQEIDQLINSINNFIRRLTEDEKLDNPIARSRRPRSSSQPVFIPPNLESRLNNINNQIKATIKDIEKMKNISEVSNDTREMLNQVEGTLELLQKQYDNENRVALSKKENLEEFISTSECAIKDFQNFFNIIKHDFEENQKQEKQTSLENKIIHDIKSREFEEAVKHLSVLSDLNGKLETNVNYIVNRVYDNSESNFYLILPFGDSSKDARTSFAIYQALNYEMERNEHNDYHKVLQLIKNLISNVIYNPTSSDVLNEAEKFKSILHNAVKSITGDALTKALIRNDHSSVFKIFESIHLNYPLLYNEVLREVLNSTIHLIDTVKLVKFFESHKFVAQSIFGYSIMFEIFQKSNGLNQRVVVNLAFGLKEALNLCEYNQLPNGKDACSEARRLKDKLPESVRNLAMAARVCIKHVEMNEYLFSGDNHYRDGHWGLRVFTRRDQSRDSASNWIVQPIDDGYYLKNDQLRGYLYAPDDFYNPYNRHVRTLRVPSQESKWIFVPEGNLVYIKNAYYDEYLYADFDIAYNPKNRYVFCSRMRTVDPVSHVWKIEDCTEDCEGDDCLPILVNKEI